MKNDQLREFIKLRDSLTSERDQIQNRLREINEALDRVPLPSASAVSGSRSFGSKASQKSVAKAPSAAQKGGKGKRTFSAAARARIAEAARRRWAAAKAQGKTRL